ncbi:hypothetical protein [Bifidobacterium sp. ESL0745]|uniref:hypothetical protein n=1 Tax=Bifidobacterium sp. ESL0745 TaxID=2983226 RepID=UPI0023F87503|nr:hypothetical protein [Bifidobacterium sp. ESL0745]MDF7664528.1 hypothetical protein [Bifidobacterium sp. ESL0745]
MLALVQPPMPQTAQEEGIGACFRSPQPSSKSSPSVKKLTSHSFGRHTVIFLSASGGVGLSALCSLTALELKTQSIKTSLVDADFDAGGLDVLLGLENDKGLRFGMLDVPLGKIDGEVLRQRLPQWEGVPVLAFDSWNGEIPEWWEVKAVLEALERASDMVLVDGARGRLIKMIPDLCSAPIVIAVELSVLGLARAKALLGRLVSFFADGSGMLQKDHFGDFFGPGPNPPSYSSRCRPSHTPSRSYNGNFAVDEGAERRTSPRSPQLAAIVGIETRGTSRRRGVVNVDEASEYLGHEVLGPICPNSARTSDALEGLGLKAAKSDRTVMGKLARAISESVEGDDGH